MTVKISASAISRIISGTNIKKAHRTGWSTGFYVTGYDVRVEVTYQSTEPDHVERNLAAIVETINGRADRKYFAKIGASLLGGEGLVVVVVRRDDTNPEHNGDLTEDLTPVEEESSEQICEALMILREGVEWDLAHATRRAGDHSIFVLSFPHCAVVPRRVEVFYSNGEYKTKGYGRGEWFRFSEVGAELKDFIRDELAF
jgi:hypothetical protein